MSCYGYRSIEELINSDLLDLNDLKSINLNLDNIKNNNCKIPGYDIKIPSINLSHVEFNLPIELPQYLCLLPNIPKLPSIKLPGFKIPIIPIPYIPAIPIPFPDISVRIPRLPKLPSLSLPMITFLCPFIQINTPTINIFKDINSYINKYNNSIDILLNYINNINNVCQLINIIKNRTEIFDSIGYINDVNEIIKESNKTLFIEKGGSIKVKELTNKNKQIILNKPNYSKYYNVKEKINKEKLNNILKNKSDNKRDISDKIAYQLSIDKIIPIHFNILKFISDHIEKNLDSYNSIDLLIDDIAKLIDINKIPTTDDNKYLSLDDIDNILSEISNKNIRSIFRVYETNNVYNTYYSNELSNKIITKGQLIRYLIDIKFINKEKDIEAIYNNLPENILDLNPFTLLSLLNSTITDYDIKIKDTVTKDDVVYTFYLFPIKDYSIDSIIDSFVKAKIIENSNENIIKAREVFSNIKNYSLDTIIKSINNLTISSDINVFRLNYLFSDSINKNLDVSNISFNNYKISKEEFLYKISNFADNIIFPTTIYDISEYLSYIFNIDSSNFNDNNTKLNNYDDIYKFINNNIFKRNIFNYDDYVIDIKNLLFNIDINNYKDISAILCDRYNCEYNNLYNTINKIKPSSYEEIAFILLMFGFFKKVKLIKSFYNIYINSPTGNVYDIIDNSINIYVYTKNKKIKIIDNGSPIMTDINIIKNKNINEYKIEIINIYSLNNFDVINHIDISAKYIYNNEEKYIDNIYIRIYSV